MTLEERIEGLEVQLGNTRRDLANCLASIDTGKQVGGVSFKKEDELRLTNNLKNIIQKLNKLKE